jgi:tetratricopeptide (TPR) repeat protein
MLATINNEELLAAAKTSYKNKDYQKAIAEYDRAIALNPEDAYAYSCRGSCYCRLGNSALATADYNRSIELEPEVAMTYYRRGFIHFMTRNYWLALGDYNRAIDLDPNFALAYSNRSHVYRQLYGNEEALIDLRWAAKLFQQQGNFKKYQETMAEIEQISSFDSWASGML